MIGVQSQIERRIAIEATKIYLPMEVISKKLNSCQIIGFLAIPDG
jgi:hypothetical protein